MLLSRLLFHSNSCKSLPIKNSLLINNKLLPFRSSLGLRFLSSEPSLLKSPPQIDPKSPSFSPISPSQSAPLDLSQKYRSPYATRFPNYVGVPRTALIERPYERLVTLRRLVRKSKRGKLFRYDAWVLVGDRNGSAGVAHSQASHAYKAVSAATRRAKNTMRHFDLFEGRTLYHDIDVHYNGMTVKLYAKPPGYSIKAQRNIQDFCSALGIQDMAARIIVGSTNPITVTKLMFHALEHLHKTPTKIAELRGKQLVKVQREHTGLSG